MEHSVRFSRPIRPKLLVTVMTGAEDSNEPASKVINWRDSSDRKWLQSHQHWAMLNNQVVVLKPNR